MHWKTNQGIFWFGNLALVYAHFRHNITFSSHVWVDSWWKIERRNELRVVLFYTMWVKNRLFKTFFIQTILVSMVKTWNRSFFKQFIFMLKFWYCIDAVFVHIFNDSKCKIKCTWKICKWKYKFHLFYPNHELDSKW